FCFLCDAFAAVLPAAKSSNRAALLTATTAGWVNRRSTEFTDGKWLIAHHHSSAMPEHTAAK
ncbi:MAG: hypothetical protein ABIP64_03355, partial [Burkholderiales bacterium]